ncbi:MAG: hypothetical protein ACUVSK_09675 [Desulfotomaculales bacterium]
MTEYWPLTKDTCALYTENANLEAPALAAKLRPMATYAKNGRLFAKQFAGPKDVVINLAQRKYPFKPFNVPVDCLNNELVTEYKKRCAGCRAVFLTEARNARFCSECAENQKKVKNRERKRRSRSKEKGGVCHAF